MVNEITGREVAGGQIMNANMPRRMSRSVEELQRSFAQVDGLLVVDKAGRLAGRWSIALEVEGRGRGLHERAIDQILAYRGCLLPITLGEPLFFGGVNEDVVKEGMIADMIPMGMGADNGNGKRCELADVSKNIVDAQSGINECRPLFADKQIGVEFHPLSIFAESERKGIDLLHRKPIGRASQISPDGRDGCFCAVHAYLLVGLV